MRADRETECCQQIKADIEHRERARHSACFVVRFFQRSLRLVTRLCLQGVECVRSVGVAMKMLSLPWRTRRFEAAGKQHCCCMAWSRKYMTGFISRQDDGVPVFCFMLDFRTNCPGFGAVLPQKLKWREAMLGSFPALIVYQQMLTSLSTAAHKMCCSS